MFGLDPLLAPKRPPVLVTLSFAVPLVILSTCTVHPVLKFVPVIPLLPLVQVNTGIAGLFAALQAFTITALLERHMDSPAPCAFAVNTSLLLRPETLIDQLPPDETVVVPIDVDPLNS